MASCTVYDYYYQLLFRTLYRHLERLYIIGLIIILSGIMPEGLSTLIQCHYNIIPDNKEVHSSLFRQVFLMEETTRINVVLFLAQIVTTANSKVNRK